MRAILIAAVAAVLAAWAGMLGDPMAAPPPLGTLWRRAVDGEDALGPAAPAPEPAETVKYLDTRRPPS